MSSITQEQIETGIQAGTYRRMANGVIQDVATGRIVTNPNPSITTANARQMVERRKQKMIQATMRGLAEGGDPDGRSSAKAWAHVVQAMTELAISKGKGATQAADFLAKAIGMYGNNGNTHDVQESERGTVQISISADVALELAHLAAEYRRQALQHGNGDTLDDPVTVDQRVIPGDYKDA